jgi:hypothetical protein
VGKAVVHEFGAISPAAGDSGFQKDDAQVVLNRSDLYAEGLRDVGIAVPREQELEDLGLPRRE